MELVCRALYHIGPIGSIGISCTTIPDEYSMFKSFILYNFY